MTVLVALISLVLLSAFSTSLIVVVDTDVRASANYAASREAMYAADGALNIAVHELQASADWNTLLAGGALSTFVDGPPTGARPLGDGNSVDLAQATQAANEEPRPWGANNPVWRLFGYGWLGPKTYVLAWIADDDSENDGDASIDGGGSSNPGAGILALRAEGFGTGGAHKVLEATARRELQGGGSVVRIVSWREIR
jgi:hypothetical protein